MANSVGSCQILPRSLDVAPGSFIDTNQTCAALNDSGTLAKSSTLALDQAPKMTKRYDYLKAIADEASLISTNLRALITAIDGAPDLDNYIYQMNESTSANPASNATGQRVDNTLIYGWRSDPTTTNPAGAWHLVQVQAWSPKRCVGYWAPNFANPFVGQTDFDPSLQWACCTNSFPWVKSEKEGELKRCYRLKEHSGRVKVRVARYDESGTNSLNFNNKVPLWKFRYANPFNTDPSVPDLSQCEFVPPFAFAALPLHRHWDYVVAPGAFMIYDKSDYIPPALEYGAGGGRRNGAQCKLEVAKALSKAVVSESCVIYYLRPGSNRYEMRFGRCNTRCAAEGISPNAN
jgi:hypothetical protein